MFLPFGFPGETTGLGLLFQAFPPGPEGYR